MRRQPAATSRIPCDTVTVMLEVRQTAIYAEWFAALRDRRQGCIDIRIRRLSPRNPGDVKPVGEGVSSCASTTAPVIASTCSTGQGVRGSARRRTSLRKIATSAAKALARECGAEIWARPSPLPGIRADHLGDRGRHGCLPEAALEEGDPVLVAAAPGDIAPREGHEPRAREAGLGREPQGAFPSGNPEFATILKVVSALGLQLHAAPGKRPKARPDFAVAAEEERNTMNKLEIHPPSDLNSPARPRTQPGRLRHPLPSPRGDSWFTVGALNPPANANLLFEMRFGADRRGDQLRDARRHLAAHGRYAARPGFRRPADRSARKRAWEPAVLWQQRPDRRWACVPTAWR